MLRAAAIGVLASFALNLVWENAQAFLYRGYEGLGQHFLTCFIATLGDVVIVAAIYCAVAVLWHDYAWYRRITIAKITSAALLGLGTAIVIEAWALAAGRWAYDGMPLLPFIPVGPTPLLQMVILPSVVFAIMRVLTMPEARVKQ